MKPVVTILYEDSVRRNAGGEYPLHDLVMRMVEDDINGESWRLRKLVFANPRNGVTNILRDIKSRTSLIASGGKIFLLIDRDKVARHLKLGGNPSDEEIIEKIRESSDAPSKVEVFFLHPNLEGLIQAIQKCDPGMVAASVFESALGKSLNDRDIVFQNAKLERWTGRACVRAAQPGLDAMIRALGELIALEAVL